MKYQQNAGRSSGHVFMEGMLFMAVLCILFTIFFTAPIMKSIQMYGATFVKVSALLLLNPLGLGYYCMAVEMGGMPLSLNLAGGGASYIWDEKTKRNTGRLDFTPRMKRLRLAIKTMVAIVCCAVGLYFANQYPPTFIQQAGAMFVYSAWALLGCSLLLGVIGLTVKPLQKIFSTKEVYSPLAAA